MKNVKQSDKRIQFDTVRVRLIVEIEKRLVLQEPSVAIERGFTRARI